MGRESARPTSSARTQRQRYTRDDGEREQLHEISLTQGRRAGGEGRR